MSNITTCQPDPEFEMFVAVTSVLALCAGWATFLLECWRHTRVEENNEVVNMKMFEIDVFRFMDGTSCYILDDDDEYVFVHTDNITTRIREFSGVTHCDTGDEQYVVIDYVDMYGGEGTIRVDDFYDDFESEKFAEFITQFIEKTDSDSDDEESDIDKDD